MSKLIVRSSLILVALLMIRGDFIYFQSMRGEVGDDFWVYYTGAWAVRSGQSSNLYEAAGRDVDPSNVFYDPTTPQPVLDKAFIQTGRMHGIRILRIYIYPPTLADLLMPLTFVSPQMALNIWFAFNAAALLGISVLLALWTRTSGSAYFVGVLVFTLLLPPTVASLLWGQVTVLLLWLLLAGIHLYLREKRVGAAFLFALAAMIKLTPLIVIFPLISWRDWKTVRGVLLWSTALFAAVIAINGWGPLQLYFLQEMPKIGSDLVLDNRTLNSLLQVLYLRRSSGQQSTNLAVIAKILGIVLIWVVSWLSHPAHKERMQTADKFEALAAIFFLSACISPLSWEQAYIVAVPLLWVWANRAWKEGPNLELGLLLLFGISFSTWKLHLLFLLTPISGIAISILTLYRIWRKGERRCESPFHQGQAVDAR